MPSILLLLLIFLLITVAAASSSSPVNAQTTISGVNNITRITNTTTYFLEGVFNGAVIDQINDKGYFATFTVPGIIVRMNLATLSREAAIRFANIDAKIGYFGKGIEICGKAYFPCETSPRGAFVQIDLNRFEVTAIRYGEIGEYQFTAPVSYLDFIVFGTKSTPAYLIEYNLATLTRTNRNMTLPEANVRASISKGRVAFFVLGLIGGKIAKIDLGSMRQLEIFFDASMSLLSTVCGGFDPNFGTIYNQMDYIFSLSTTTSSTITISQLSSALSLPQQQSQMQSSFLYIGTGQQSAGSFYKINVTENITLVAVETLNKRNNASYVASITTIVVAQSISQPSIKFIVDSFLIRDIVFFLQTSSTGVLYRVNATNFSNPVFPNPAIANSHKAAISYVDNISGKTGEDFNVMVTDGEHVFVGTNSMPGGILEYDLGVANSPNHEVNDSATPIGTLFDSFGVGSVDMNTIFSCTDRGNYIGQGFSIRLSPVHQGLVEVRIFNSSVWGVISNDLFNANTAAGLCNMLGVRDVTWATFYTHAYSPFNNTLANLSATTSSSSLSPIPFSLASVVASSGSFLTNASITANTNKFGSLSSSVSTLFPTVYPALLSQIKHPFDAPVFFDDLICPNNARYIDNCTFKVYFLNDAAPSESVGLNCYAQDQKIQQKTRNESDVVVSGDWKFRLARNGRVDIKLAKDTNATWGTMCNRGMSRFTPAAICRILGFPQGSGSLTVFRNMETLFEDYVALNLTGTTNISKIVAQNPIYLSQVYCPQTMSAKNFSTDCTFERYNYFFGEKPIDALDASKIHGYNPSSTRYCNHTHAVGVICNGNPDDGVYIGNRLFLRLNRDSENLVSNSVSGQGTPYNNNKNRVESRKLLGVISTSGADVYSEWKPVCKSKSFDVSTGLALCRMLGYEPKRHVAYHPIHRESLRSVLQVPKGVSRITCENENAKHIGYCGFTEHFGEASPGVCGSDTSDEIEFGLICDAEEKGVRSGDFFWKSSTLQTEANGFYYLQSRPAPSYSINFTEPALVATSTTFNGTTTTTSSLQNVTTTLSNAYPVSEGFGSVVVEGYTPNKTTSRASFYLSLLYNLTFASFGQTEANLICQTLGFSSQQGTNHQFSTSSKLTISNPFVDENFWEDPASYNPNTNIDKIVLTNLSCSSAADSLQSTFCSYNLFSSFVRNRTAELINYNFSSTLVTKSGGTFGTVITLKCDRGGVYTEKDILGLAMIVLGAVLVVVVSLLILWLLIKCGVLADSVDDEEEDVQRDQNNTSGKTKEQIEKSKTRGVPPPLPSSTDSSDDGRNNNSNNNNNSSSNGNRGAVLISPQPPGRLLRVSEEFDNDDEEEDDEEEFEEEIVTTLSSHLSPEYQRRLDARADESKYKGGVLGTRHRYLAGYDEGSAPQNYASPPSNRNHNSDPPPVNIYPTFEQISTGRSFYQQQEQQQQHRTPNRPLHLASPSVMSPDDTNANRYSYSSPNNNHNQQLPPLAPTASVTRRSVLSPNFPGHQ